LVFGQVNNQRPRTGFKESGTFGARWRQTRAQTANDRYL
jgi:hypothetical protein